MADDDPIKPVNPFAPRLDTAPMEPVELEFEMPPRAVSYLERPQRSDLPQLLQQADPGAGVATDEQRVALEKLVTMFRQQRDELRRGERRLIDLALIEFFKRILADRGLRALVNADPADAARFLYGPRKRGRRASSTITFRDLRVTREVVKLMGSGKAREDAIDAVATRRGLEWERVEKIYNRYRRQVRLHRARI